MEFNDEFKKKLIKGDGETVESLVEQFADKAYSFALCFLGDRFAAEEAVKQSFSAFFAHIGSLLRENSVPAAYFAVLKGWCERRVRNEINEKGEYLYDLSAFSHRDNLPAAIASVISKLNRKERGLFLLTDVVCLPRDVICEIYDAERDAVSVAISDCRDSVRAKLAELGDFTGVGGDAK